MSMGDKIKILMHERGVTQTELGNRIGISQSNLANKFKRDNFTERDLNCIANALNATFIGVFKLNDQDRSI